MCVVLVNYPPNTKPMYDGEYIVMGACAYFYTLPDHPSQVIKVPKPNIFALGDIEIEKRIYRRLGKHPHLANVVAMDEYGIYLQLAPNGCLREYYRRAARQHSTRR